VGAACLFGIQQWAHREAVKAKAAAALKTALTAARVSHAGPSSSGDSSRGSFQQHSRNSCNLQDGCFVCFKDRTGQVAVIQPCGSGGCWQLSFTCAPGGSCLLPEGERWLGGA
jgi:hypothetical protein